MPASRPKSFEHLMKAKKPVRPNGAKSQPMRDVIADYAAAQTPAHAEICQAVGKEIGAGLKHADSKIWHAMPVWFVNGTPVVGYKATPKHVVLLFWNGQAFEEEALIAAGKFRAAQITFTESAQIDRTALRRW